MYLSRRLAEKFTKLIKVTNTSRVKINSGRIPVQIQPIDIHTYKLGDHCLIEYDTFDEHDNPQDYDFKFEDKHNTAKIQIEEHDFEYENLKNIKLHVPIFSNILTVEAEHFGQTISVKNVEPTKLKVFIGSHQLEKWENPIDTNFVDRNQQHQYTPEQNLRKYPGQKNFKLTEFLTNVELENIKALRSIQVKSKKHPINLVTNRTITTMRLTNVFSHYDSKISLNGPIKVKILDLEAGEISGKKNIFLKQGVIQSNRGDVNLRSISSNSVLGVTASRNLLVKEIEGEGQMTFNANEYRSGFLR